MVDPTWAMLWLILLIPGIFLGIAVHLILWETDNAIFAFLSPFLLGVVALGFPTLLTGYIYAQSIRILEDWFGSGNAFAGLLISTVLTSIGILIGRTLKSED